MVKKVFSFIFLGFLWLFLSPVYVLIRVFGFKRKVGSTLLFALLSPSTWLLGIVLYYLGLNYYNENYKLTSRRELSQVTGVELPAFRIVDKNMGNIAFNGNQSNRYEIEFKVLPDEGFYSQLDSVCKLDSYWSRRVEDKQVKYSYSRMWGNGMEAPEGQDPDEDRFVSFFLVKGEMRASMTIGTW